MTDSFNTKFLQYKDKLKQIHVAEIGQIISIDDANALKDNPSISYKAFVDGLTDFLQQPYMQPIFKVAKLQIIPADRIMLIDRPTLERGSELVDAFEDYIINKTADLPDTHRVILEHLGRVNIRHHVLHLLGKSQAFKSKPAKPSSLEIEQNLYTATKNLQDIQPTLRNTIDKSYIVDSFGEEVLHIRKVMVEYGEGLLQQIESLVAKDGLYAIHEDVFKVWNGRDMLGLAAFGASDIDEVERYLASQRDRISFIAKNFAAPVVAFLQLRFLDGAPKNLKIIQKWENVLKQVADYEKASPNNTIKKLESFIEYDLNKITGNACLGLLETGVSSTKNQDFFLQTRNELRARVVSRCGDIMQTRARKNYMALSKFFNSYISNRFPFTVDPKSIKSQEADPQDLKTLIDLYDLFTAGEKRAIRMFFDKPGLKETPANFLTQLDVVMPFIKAAMNYVPKGESSAPKILFNVEFDAKKSSEKGREYVLDRMMEVANRPITSKDKAPTGDWSINDLIKVKFRWASNESAVRVPRKDSDQDALEIEDNTSAVFTYQGKWSLLKMVRNHAVSIKENDPAQPIVLQFDIPTSIDPNAPAQTGAIVQDLRTNYATLYVTLYMLTATSVSADDSGGAKPTPMAFPVFPFRAPSLDNFDDHLDVIDSFEAS